MTRIPYVNLAIQWQQERDHLLPIVENILEGGQYIGSKEVDNFEIEAAAAFKVGHVVALNSGTDALVCGLVAVGVGRGDEVITPPNSFVASTGAIVHIGARPVFVDVKPDQNINPCLIEKAITKKTKAIMPVHLTGRMCDMHAIMEIANKHDIPVVEDAAQSAGSALDGKTAGSWGEVGCFSAHPLKNLNACGDAGFVTTRKKHIAEKIRAMRNHGLVDRDTVAQFGHVSRMDSIQAGILQFRLSRLQTVIKKRKRHAALYREMLDDHLVFCPPDMPGESNSWHTFVIQIDRRDELRSMLAERGVETAIHYPVPIHLQPAAEQLGYGVGAFPEAERQAKRILTLPVHQNLTDDEIQYICNLVNQFVATQCA